MTAFWDTAPYSLVEVDRRFNGAFCLHHQSDDRPDDGGIFAGETLKSHTVNNFVLRLTTVSTWRRFCTVIDFRYCDRLIGDPHWVLLDIQMQVGTFSSCIPYSSTARGPGASLVCPTTTSRHRESLICQSWHGVHSVFIAMPSVYVCSNISLS
jgi:hypothetical protein